MLKDGWPGLVKPEMRLDFRKSVFSGIANDGISAKWSDKVLSYILVIPHEKGQTHSGGSGVRLFQAR